MRSRSSPGVSATFAAYGVTPTVGAGASAYWFHSLETTQTAEALDAPTNFGGGGGSGAGGARPGDERTSVERVLAGRANQPKRPVSLGLLDPVPASPAMAPPPAAAPSVPSTQQSAPPVGPSFSSPMQWQQQQHQQHQRPISSFTNSSKLRSLLSPAGSALVLPHHTPGTTASQPPSALLVGANTPAAGADDARGPGSLLAARSKSFRIVSVLQDAQGLELELCEEDEEVPPSRLNPFTHNAQAAVRASLDATAAVAAAAAASHASLMVIHMGVFEVKAQLVFEDVTQVSRSATIPRSSRALACPCWWKERRQSWCRGVRTRPVRKRGCCRRAGHAARPGGTRPAAAQAAFPAAAAGHARCDSARRAHRKRAPACPPLAGLPSPHV